MTGTTLITVLAGTTLVAGLGFGIAGVRGARKAKENREKSALADE